MSLIKTLHSNQTQKIDGPDAYPIYFVHIFLTGETLYLSDRNFKYNGHDYEAYLHNLPDLANQIERFGGYLNFNGRLKFINSRFRAYDYLSQFFEANPITRREMELYVLYHETGEIYGSDVSTKLLRAAFGQVIDETKPNFSYELFSILHTLDNKKLFTQINRANWPNAAPSAIGKYENRLIGAIRDMPCHPVDVGPFSTLYADVDDITTTLTLADVSYPIPFDNSGTVQIGNEKIAYTGRNTTANTLTGCTRGASSTRAAYHSAGDVVWPIRSSYKYLADSGSIKAVSTVYVGQTRTRINPSKYTVNLNDGGKTTVAFTERPMEAHAHNKNEIEVHRPNAGSYQDILGTMTWQGDPAAMTDNNLDTWFAHVQYSGSFASPRTGAFHIDFPAYNGATPKKIYAVFVMNTNVGTQCGEYVRLEAPQQINIGELSGKTTVRLALTGTTVPTRLTIYSHHDACLYVDLMCQIFEAWIELEGTLVDPSASDMDSVVTFDGEGYKDDGSGTYTGVANALIENPSDVRRFILIGLLGRTSADIGSSFADMRTTYNGRSTPYKLAMNLPKIGLTASEIFKRLDEQTRSQMREDGGKFELNFHLGTTPTPIMTIDKTIFIGEPVFKMTPSVEIKNLLRAVFDLDHGGNGDRKKFGDYFGQIEISDSASITKYGELPEEITFPAVRIQGMVEDVLPWRLAQKKDVIWEADLVCKWFVRKLERNDYFLLRHELHDNTLWRVLEIEEVPGKQQFRLHAIQYVGT